MRAIDADVLIPKIKFVLEAEHQIYGEESWDFAGKCLDEIEHAPTIEPERKPGKWIEISKFNHSYKCSICGRTLINITDGKNTVTKNYPFCHCGADMRGNKKQ